MNIKSLVIAAAFTGVLAASATAATFTAPAVIQAPSPAKVVAPVALPDVYRGSTVTVWLKVDAAGRPSAIRVKGSEDERLVRQLTQAVSQWEFTPARRNGVAVSTHVELPLQLVEG